MNEELKKAIQEMKDSSINGHHNSSTLEDEVYPPITSPREEVVVSTLSPQDTEVKEVSKCCGVEIEYDTTSDKVEVYRLCSKCKKDCDVVPSPKVSEWYWESEFEDKFVNVYDEHAEWKDKKTSSDVPTKVKNFISSLISSTEKRVANEIIGEIENMVIETVGNSAMAVEEVINLIKSKYDQSN